MKVSLVVMNPGKTAGHAIPITLSQFTIGRDPQCNLRPSSPVISKRHCAILIKNGKVTLRDFDSTNGTFIGETPVKGEVPLEHDSILKIGPLTFRVVIERPVPVDKPTPPPAKKNPGSDEDVADMLLSLPEGQTEEEEIATASADDDDGVPGGSTVMDMPAGLLGSVTSLEGTMAEKAAPKSATPPPPPKKSATPPPPSRAATPPPPTVAAASAVSDTAETEAVETEAVETEPAAAEPTAPEPVAEPTLAPVAKKPEEKKPPQHNSARDAARAILEKYVKRNRGS